MYLKGNSEVLSKNGLAAVGTRHPTPYGTGIAKRLTCDLAARGLAITSGMARGIETAAHRGALNAHGLTTAVWRTRIDVTYPKKSKACVIERGEIQRHPRHRSVGPRAGERRLRRSRQRREQAVLGSLTD